MRYYLKIKLITLILSLIGALKLSSVSMCQMKVTMFHVITADSCCFWNVGEKTDGCKRKYVKKLITVAYYKIPYKGSEIGI